MLGLKTFATIAMISVCLAASVGTVYAINPEDAGDYGSAFDVRQFPASEKSPSSTNPFLRFDYLGSALWNGVERTVISDNYVFAAMVFGIRVIDITNPADPQIVSELYIPRIATQGMALQDGLLYIVSDDRYVQVRTFLVVDVSDPLNPTLRGSMNLGTPLAYDVAVAGNVAYVVTEAGLQLINISNPDLPQLISKRTLGGSPQKVVVQGSDAFVAYAGGGISEVDVSNPASPALVRNITTGGAPVGLAISGNFAYVTLADSLLRVVDLSLNTVVETYPIRSVYSGQIEGSYLYITATADTLKVFDISNAPVLTEIASVSFLPYSIEAVAGSIALLADWHTGIAIVDIGAPSAPGLSSTLSFPPYPAVFKIAVVGDYAYCLNPTEGLKVVNISDPQNMTVVGKCDLTGGNARGMALVGGFALVAADISGLEVIDISNPLSPSLVNSLNTPGRARSVEVSGTRAYVADREGGIRIVDISNPSAPVELGFWVDGLSSDFLDVTAQGDFIYAVAGVTSDSSKLYILEVSNPANPQLKSTFEYSNTPLTVAMVQNFVYIGTFSQRLIVVDVSDPENPVGTEELIVYDMPHEIVFGNGYAYIANFADGLLAMDITNPGHPTYAGEFPTALGWAVGIAIAGDRTYLATDNGMIVVESSTFSCGDADGNGLDNISDAVYLISYIFAGGSAPNPVDAGDSNCDSIVSISDAVSLINYIFAGGPAPCAQCLGN